MSQPVANRQKTKKKKHAVSEVERRERVPVEYSKTKRYYEELTTMFVNFESTFTPDQIIFWFLLCIGSIVTVITAIARR